MLAAVLSVCYPQMDPHLMAYLRVIPPGQAATMRAQLGLGRNRSGPICEAFTGRAKIIPRYRYCLSDNHVGHDCVFAPEPVKPTVNTLDLLHSIFATCAELSVSLAMESWRGPRNASPSWEKRWIPERGSCSSQRRSWCGSSGHFANGPTGGRASENLGILDRATAACCASNLTGSVIFATDDRPTPPPT